MHRPIRLLSALLLAAGTATAAPLFESNEPLEVTIEAPFKMPLRTAPDFTSDTIVVVDTDEWDVRYVVTAVIRR